MKTITLHIDVEDEFSIEEIAATAASQAIDDIQRSVAAQVEAAIRVQVESLLKDAVIKPLVQESVKSFLASGEVQKMIERNVLYSTRTEIWNKIANKVKEVVEEHDKECCSRKS